MEKIEIRPDIGGWIEATLRALRENAHQLVAPALAGFAAYMLITLPLVVVGVAFGILLAVAEQRGGVEWMLPLFLLFFVAAIAFSILVNAVLLHGIYRYSLALLRGERATPGLLIPGLGEAFGSVALISAQIGGAFLGALFCLIPGIWIGLSLALAGVSYADRRQGITDAVASSLQLTRGRKLNLYLFNLVVALGATLLAYIPFVGVALMFPVMGMAYAVVYESLRGELDGA